MIRVSVLITLVVGALAKEGVDNANLQPYPGQPQPYQPGYPQPYQPGYPQPYQPGYPQPYQPGNPQPYQPGYPQPYQPNNPYPIYPPNPYTNQQCQYTCQTYNPCQTCITPPPLTTNPCQTCQPILPPPLPPQPPVIIEPPTCHTCEVPPPPPPPPTCNTCVPCTTCGSLSANCLDYYGPSVCPHASPVNVLLPHPADPSHFCQCANGTPVDQPCAPGTIFDPVLSVCD